MELQNTHAPAFNPDKRYSVTFILVNGHRENAVLRGAAIDAIRAELGYAHQDRDGSIFWESEDFHFLPMPSIVHMYVSRTGINCDPNTIT